MTVKEMDIFNTTPSPQQKQHWLAEQILCWSGLPVVEVTTNGLHGRAIPSNRENRFHADKIKAPFGKGKNSAIAALDVARVIAEILSEPADHIDQTYHLTGPVSQDMDAVAREFSAALGRTISYVNVPLEVMKGQLAAFGMPPHVVAHVATMARLNQDNRYDRFSNDVERLTGIRPMSVREFVQKNAHAFAPVAGAERAGRLNEHGIADSRAAAVLEIARPIKRHAKQAIGKPASERVKQPDLSE